MKVVFFSRFPGNINEPCGGVESATVNLAKALSRMSDVDLHVVTFEKDIKQVEVINEENITIHRLPGSRTFQIIDILAGPGHFYLKKYLKHLDPDIIHFHETYGLGVGKLNAPYVFTVHGFDSENIPVESGRLGRFSWLRSPLWKLVEFEGLKRQKHIISITPYVKKHIKTLTHANIYDIDNAISSIFFDTPHKPIKGRIFSVGWISHRKNTLGIIKAFSRLMGASSIDASLYIAGERKNPEYAKKVDKEIKKSNIENKIRFLGKLSQEEIREELSCADIFVLPSYQENAPMAIAEAMAAGVPVVTSNRCGMPYMIDEGKTGFLVDPDDIEALADRMRILLTDVELRSKIGEAARHLAKERFHPDSVAQKTKKVYEEILKKADESINCKR